MSERETPVISRQELPYTHVSSPEFSQAFSSLHISQQPRLPVVIHQFPRDSSGLAKELKLQHWLISPTGEKLETALINQAKLPVDHLRVGIAVHGYACAGLPGKTPKNYWSAVTAALNVSAPPYPVLAFDLPSYNPTPEDQKTLAVHPWLKKIDHYPYVFLQALEEQLTQIEEALWELPAVTPAHASTAEIPVTLEVMAHSIGGRAAMVAASLDEGTRLSQLITHWQQRLGRPLHLHLNILEPAFGLQSDLLINTVNFLNNPVTRILVKANPLAAILTLRGMLGSLRGRYHLSTHDDFYPLRQILQAGHLAQIIAHPHDIAQLPELPVRTPAQLTQQGLPTQVIVASLDNLVDNDATRKVFKLPPGTSPASWSALQAESDSQTLSLVPNPHATPQATGTILLKNAGHTAELDAPGIIAALIQNTHV